METCCHSNPSKKPSDNTDGKNSKGVNNNNNNNFLSYSYMVFLPNTNNKAFAYSLLYGIKRLIIGKKKNPDKYIRGRCAITIATCDSDVDLNHLLSKFTSWQKFCKSQEQTNYLTYMDVKQRKRIRNFNTCRKNIELEYSDGIRHKKMWHPDNDMPKSGLCRSNRP